MKKLLYLISIILLSVLVLTSCSPVAHIVEFDTDGGSIIEDQLIPSGKTATKPANPTKAGYTFDYWEYVGKEYHFNEIVTTSIKLKAIWITP